MDDGKFVRIGALPTRHLVKQTDPRIGGFKKRPIELVLLQLLLE
jgi:hypothetical protein